MKIFSQFILYLLGIVSIYLAVQEKEDPLYSLWLKILGFGAILLAVMSSLQLFLK